jgi:hypothetical protein
MYLRGSFEDGFELAKDSEGSETVPRRWGRARAR